MARIVLAFMICGAALAAVPAAAQNENSATPMAPPAPYDAPTGSIESAAPKIVPVPESKDAQPAESPPQVTTVPKGPAKDQERLEGKAPDSTPAENGAHAGTSENKPAENTDNRFTFTRMNDGYVRLDNRTGQVSVCSKRAVGWTCQLAPEDRGVLEGEITRLQEENVALKKELLANGLPLPGSMKGEPPVAHHERNFNLPTEPNIERMKVIVEKAWRRLVDMISTLQKEVLKKAG